MRPLVLHASALSDNEYNAYTAALCDLAELDDNSKLKADTDSTYYEGVTVGVREARAWLRGRYSHIPAPDIDSVRTPKIMIWASRYSCDNPQILKLFYPNLGQTDVMSGGQVLAALRLVTHFEEGKGVDRSLAFVQGK